jgi:SAM-dependent methyltransferase
MDKRIINELSEGMVSRYSERYKKMGYDVKTLGWGSREQQIFRFHQVLQSGIALSGKSVIDIGCGFGDFGKFLLEQNIQFSQYFGWDINPDLIAEATADVGVMMGVLNLDFKNRIDNFEYSKQLIQTGFKLVKEVLIVDFLSTRLSSDYPKEDFVFYHDPGQVLDFALSLSDNVSLRHDYAPIPQKEFMISIFK